MSDTLTLRNATRGDVEAIADIYGHAVLTGTASYEYDPPTPAEMASRFDAIIAGGFPWLIACAGDEIAGYAYASPFRTRPAYRFMVEDSIYIAPRWQGRGVGRQLLTRLIGECERRDFRQMIAVIGDGAVNLGSVRLHAAMGFSECGRIAGSGFKHGRWCDTVLMQKALNGGSTTLP
jgi:L-amino acid N-acyltransferase YncA